MKYVIGLDIGGTKIHSIVAEWDKDFLTTRKLPKIVKSRRVAVQNKKDGDKVFKEIVEEIRALLKEFGKDNVTRIGVGIAGPLNKDKVILNSPHLPFKNFSILPKLKKKFDLPIYVENDASCFVWAEQLFGVAHSASSTVGITLGTGVGGGIVLDRNGELFLLNGYYGGAAEVGHMILDGEHEFEQLCSSQAQYLWKGRDPKVIQEEAERGDKKAQDVYQKFGFWLGVGIANLVNVVEPEMIVIGGSFSNAWGVFHEAMQKSACNYIFSTQAKKTKIVRAKLGDDAAALGAAYLI